MGFKKGHIVSTNWMPQESLKRVGRGLFGSLILLGYIHLHLGAMQLLAASYLHHDRPDQHLRNPSNIGLFNNLPCLSPMSLVFSPVHSSVGHYDRSGTVHSRPSSTLITHPAQTE